MEIADEGPGRGQSQAGATGTIQVTVVRGADELTLSADLGGGRPS